MTYGLGIDTGGTFTDAVLLDENQQVVATAKSLTTHFDLAQGIAGALAQLPQAQLQAVNLVCLSTTLTTNSVVEGKGAPVCVLLAGYSPSGPGQRLRHFRHLRGAQPRPRNAAARLGARAVRQAHHLRP